MGATRPGSRTPDAADIEETGMTAEFREPLRLALKRTASALKADGVPFALAGGYAL